MNVAVASAAKKKKAVATALKREWAALRVLLRRLVNGILNRVFALDVKGSHRRRNVLNLLFFLAGLAFILELYPWSFWKEELRLVISDFLSNPAALTGLAVDFFKQLISALLDERAMRFLPVFVLPFILAKEFAARYLADIFEIKQMGIARQFINEVALRGGNNVLHISAANLNEKDIEQSPIVSIGGPGYVTIELDTAILVEKPDGLPRVIGPGKKIPLDGFERIRDMIDLRDQVPDPFEAGARSKDGIPIGIADARVIFSVFRDKKSPTLAEPHPFSPASIRAIVFGKTLRVTEGERIHQNWYKASTDPIWVAPMKSLITRDLSIFMATRKLEEYLASIGAPETQAIQQIEQDIANGSAPAAQPPPPFSPRSELSGLFNEFAKKFNEDQQKRGVQAQWVGVGTWKMPPGIPSQVIPEKHIEAWRLTIENMARRSDQAMKNIERDAVLLALQNIARNGPIQIHYSNRENNLDYPHAFDNLFKYYLHLLNDAIDTASKNGRPVPPSIVAAFYEVSQYYKEVYNWVGSQTESPAPESSEEKKLYAELRSRVGRAITIERLLQLEEELHPGTSRVERLQRVINAWDADMPDEPRRGPRPSAERPRRPRPQAAESQPKRDTPPTPSPEETELYNDLLAKVLGNRQTAENLIEVERQKVPRAGRLEWIRRAIEKWIKDNR